MARLQKFTFDNDFSQPKSAEDARADIDIFGNNDAADEPMALEEEEPPPPPPPTFSEDDLALAREQAYEAGRSAGVMEAEGATERLTANALHALNAQLQQAAAEQRDADNLRLQEASTVSLTVVKKLFPEMARQHALGEIEGVIHECLSQLDRDVRVTIRTNPAHADEVRLGAERAAQATAFEGKLVFSSDPRVAVGDCRVEWGDGGAERDQARIWAEIDAVILRALGLPPASR